MKLSSEDDIKKLHRLIQKDGNYILKQNKKIPHMKSMEQIKSIKYKG